MDYGDLPTWAVRVALVVALVEAVKRTVPELESRWLPPLALALGVVVTLATRYGSELTLTVALGVGVGLAAMGLFAGTKAVVTRPDPDERRPEPHG